MGASRPRWPGLDSLAFALALLAGLLVVGGSWLASVQERRASADAAEQKAAELDARAKELDSAIEESRRETPEMAYLLNVLQAQRAIEGGRPVLARDRLATAKFLNSRMEQLAAEGGPAPAAPGRVTASHPEFEWRWLDRKLKAPGSEILARGSELKGPAPEEPAASLAFAPDGRSIALGLPDGRIVVRALPGSDLRWEASGGKHPVVGVAFSHDGNLLASVDRGGGVRILDAASGKDAHPPLALDQKESRGLLFDEHGTIHSLGAPLISMKPGEPPTIAPGGNAAWAATRTDPPQFLLANGDGQLRLATPPTTPGPVDVPMQFDPTSQSCVAISPDGRCVAHACLIEGDPQLFLKFAPPQDKRVTAMPGGPVTALAFNPSGSRLAIGDDGGRVALATPVVEAIGFPPLAGSGEEPAAILGVAFSGDGNLLGAIDARGRWVAWDAAP